MPLLLLRLPLLLLLLLLLFKRRKLLSPRGNQELITKLGRDLGKNEDLRMVKLRMVRTKSERGNLGMAIFGVGGNG